jgi:hypothetical protein
MLYSLGRSKQTGIKRWRSLIFLNNPRALVGNAHNRVARLALRLLFDSGDHLFETFDMPFRLATMLFKSSLELLAVGRLRNFR